MRSLPDAELDARILAARPAKNRVDPFVPYAFLVEPEHSASGRVEDVATIFLTNRECAYRCLMCDLWKNTTDERVPRGAIPAQIDHALARLPPARHIKLYNSGNFFDRQAIPAEDYPAIIQRVRGFETVIVENHPRLCGRASVEFRERLGTNLEVAMGLESIHPGVLQRLNKHMTADDFSRAAQFLLRNNISVRAFVLLRPPFLTEAEGVEWTLRSIEFAFEHGVGCCSIIPTRGGNGVMEELTANQDFQAPRLASLEAVLSAGISLRQGRVFVDLWEVPRFFDCPACGPLRAERLAAMNLSQTILPPIACHCEANRSALP